MARGTDREVGLRRTRSVTDHSDRTDREVELRRRLRFACLGVLACYAGLTARLIYLQGIQGRQLRREAILRRQGQITLQARRGTIYGRDDQPLGASLYAGNVGFDPSVMQVDESNPKAVARMRARLEETIRSASVLLGMDESRLRSLVDAGNSQYTREKAEFDRLKGGLTVAQANVLRQAHPTPDDLARVGLTDEQEKRFREAQPRRFFPIRVGLTVEQAALIRQAKPTLVGFGVVDGTVRAYSSGSNAAQVVGFTDVNGKGAAGLELGCNKWLEGENGTAIAELDNHKREIPGTQVKSTPAQDGLNVFTTLDANVQSIATEEAQRIVDQYHPVGVSVVIVEPSTGDILALVSLPNYDANPDPERPGRRPPIPITALKDRCIGDTYEPGSTLKTLTVAAALDAGIITTSDTYYCAGQFRVNKRYIHCANGETHHRVTPQDILRESCNIGAAQIGLQMGGPRLYAAEKRFGLFDAVNLGLPVQCVGRWSADVNEQVYNPGKVARVAFGHSITTTPLHVAMAYAAIANGGVLMRPRLLTKLTDTQGRVVQQWQPQVARRVLSEQTNALVTDMLRSVVSDGTATVAAIPGYQIAGKTGTASKYRRNAYVGSFTGFFPAAPGSKPRAVILIAVDTPDATKAYFGADVAAPAFKAIAEKLMALWRVPEDDPNGTQALTALNSQRRHQQLPPLPSLAAAHSEAN